MQSNTVSYAGKHSSSDRFGNVTIVAVPNHRTESFVVSGFGNGDLIRPTSGTFTKTEKVLWTGEQSALDLPKWRELRGQLNLAYTRTMPYYDWATLENNALEKLYGQLRSGIDLSIDIAEAGSTKRMLKSMRQVIKYVKSYHPNQWAKRWLELQYGIKPLLSTVYEAASQVVAPARQGQYDVEAIATDYDGGRKSGPALNTIPVNDYWSDSRRVKAWARYTIKSQTVLQQIANWSSVNPASIAYELTPFSFVADWFYDLGGYMRNMETALLYMNNLDFCGVTKTRKYEIESFSFGSTSNLKQNVRAFYSCKYKIRTSTLFPIPNVPRFEARMGWQRVLSAAALISEAVGSRKR